MELLVSLEQLQEKEYNIIDEEYTGLEGFDRKTSVDRYMELNHDRMGEDSERLAVRNQRADKMLQSGSFPSHIPYG